MERPEPSRAALQPNAARIDSRRRCRGGLVNPRARFAARSPRDTTPAHLLAQLKQQELERAGRVEDFEKAGEVARNRQDTTLGTDEETEDE